MKLGKLFFLEIGVIIVAVTVLFLFIEINPFLVASGQDNSVEVYQEREFGNGNISITKSQIVRAPYFNYTTFDPAILVVELNFLTYSSPGTLKLAVNGRVFATVNVSPEEQNVNLSVITFSGADWVAPTSIYEYRFGNSVSFESEAERGFEGTFSYRISIRGSR